VDPRRRYTLLELHGTSVPLLRLVEAPGNILVPASSAGLPNDAIANVMPMGHAVRTANEARRPALAGSAIAPHVRRIFDRARLNAYPVS